MRQLSGTPSVVPVNDAAVYLVLDDYGPSLGFAYRETDPNQSDRRTIIENLISGEYTNPVKVTAFNEVEGWASDVSENIAREMVDAALASGTSLSPSAVKFFERHTGQDVPGELVHN